MPLPTSGNISLSQIVAEFGGSTTPKLTDYYRGGGRVPDIPANANVPTSGQISITRVYGARLSSGGPIGGGCDTCPPGYTPDGFGCRDRFGNLTPCP